MRLEGTWNRTLTSGVLLIHIILTQTVLSFVIAVIFAIETISFAIYFMNMQIIGNIFTLLINFVLLSMTAALFGFFWATITKNLFKGCMIFVSMLSLMFTTSGSFWLVMF